MKRLIALVLSPLLVVSVFASAATASQTLVPMDGNSSGYDRFLPAVREDGSSSTVFTGGTPGTYQMWCNGVYEPAGGFDGTQTYGVATISGSTRAEIQGDTSWAYRMHFRCVGLMPDTATDFSGLSLAVQAVQPDGSPSPWRAGSRVCNDLDTAPTSMCAGFDEPCKVYDGEYYRDTEATSTRAFAWSASMSCGHTEHGYGCSTGDGRNHPNGLYGTHATPIIISSPCFDTLDLSSIPAVGLTYGYGLTSQLRDGYSPGLFNSGWHGALFVDGADLVAMRFGFVDWWQVNGAQLSEIAWPVTEFDLPADWGIANNIDDFGQGMASTCAVISVSVDGGDPYVPGLVAEAAPETFLSAGTHTFVYDVSVNGDAVATGVRYDGFGVEMQDQSAPISIDENTTTITTTVSVPDDGLFITGLEIDVAGIDCRVYATGVGDRLGYDYSFDPGGEIGSEISSCFSGVDPQWLDFGWVAAVFPALGCTAETLVIPTVPLDYWAIELQASATDRVPLSWVAEAVAGGRAFQGFAGDSCPEMVVSPNATPTPITLPIASCQGQLPGPVQTMATITRSLFSMALYGGLAHMIWRTAPWNRQYNDGALW